MRNPDIERFWDRFIGQVRRIGVKEPVARWYVRRAEQYIRTYPDTPLVQHGARHVEQYFYEIGRKKQLESWQFRQVIEAIQILFVDLVRSEWARDFDWHYWLESARALEKHHAPVARNNDPLPPSYPRQQSVAVQEEVRQRHRDVVQRVTGEIRRRQYSIRTEQVYVSWIVRYLAFHDGTEPREMGQSDVVAFLEYLAVGREVSASTQNQALNALVFLYDQVLQQPLGTLGGVCARQTSAPTAGRPVACRSETAPWRARRYHVRTDGRATLR